MSTIYTLGYARSTVHDVRIYAAKLNALIVDVRFKPFSRNPVWTLNALRTALGEIYIHVPEYGNANYKGGPIFLHDPPAALERIKPLLEHKSVILLCVCDSPRKCHRSNAAFHLSGATGLEIEHLPAKCVYHGSGSQYKLAF